jgi:beta-lactamase class D
MIRLILESGQLKADVVLSSALETADAPKIQGNSAEVDQRFTPASTFKIVLAGLALEEHWITPETEVLCDDAHVPGAPRRLRLHEALYLSSNAYFSQWNQSLSATDLEAWTKRVGYGVWNLKPVKRDLGWRAGGGFVEITPREQHAFLRRFFQGQLPWSPATQDALRPALVWPSPRPDTHLWGKTGSLQGIYWFTGAAERDGKTRVITVLLTKPGSNRDKAIQRFLDEAFQ